MNSEPEEVMAVDEAPRRRPRWGRWLLAILAVLLIVGGLYALKLRGALYQEMPLTAAVPFTVKRGATPTTLALDLQTKGLIPDAWALRVYARLTRQGTHLLAGEYEAVPDKPHRPIDLLDMVVHGRARRLSITFTEGKWATEDVAVVKGTWPQQADAFLKETKDMAAWRAAVSFPLPGDSLEGYLFPDTYSFAPSADAHAIVAARLKTFGEKCAAAYNAAPPTDGRTLQQVLILASLVEAEAQRPEERAHIAGVYMSRLKKPMRLQCDATVVYARGLATGTRQRRVTNADLKVDSPYNTYTHDGLPPAPICNPGLDSFMAALNPQKTDDLYYVARGDGSHIFTKTLAEHNAAIQRVRGGQ